MQINILLPHKEKFTKDKLSSVSITIQNNFKFSKFKNKIKIFGQYIENPLYKDNFIGIKNSKNFFLSKNVNLVNQMCKFILSSKDKNQIIEIHNRPYLIKNLIKIIGDKFPITIFFHNDPLYMKGSKSIEDREFILKNVSKVLCVSNYIKNRYLLGIKHNKNKVKILYNGIVRTNNKFPLKKKEVIFVGRIVKEKGVHLYAEVVKELIHIYKDWKFKIIGSPKLGENVFKDTYSKSIINIVKSCSNKNFELTGHISPKKVKKKMRDASIIVIPSIWDEPFGLVGAEAMCHGIAIISSDVGGLSEIIGRNGIRISKINKEKLFFALNRLLSNPLEIKKMQKKSWNSFNFDAKRSSSALDQEREKIFSSFF